MSDALVSTLLLEFPDIPVVKELCSPVHLTAGLYKDAQR